MDHYSFPPLFKACKEIGGVGVGVLLHGMVFMLGIERYVVVVFLVTDFYLNSWLLIDVRRRFDRLVWKDAVSWSSIIWVLAKGVFLWRL